MNQAFVYDAVRTPFGKFASGLAGVRPDDLAAHVIKESVKRAPALDPERIDEVVFGNANGAGEEQGPITAIRSSSYRVMPGSRSHVRVSPHVLPVRVSQRLPRPRAALDRVAGESGQLAGASLASE